MTSFNDDKHSSIINFVSIFLAKSLAVFPYLFFLKIFSTFLSRKYANNSLWLFFAHKWITKLFSLSNMFRSAPFFTNNLEMSKNP